MNDRQRFLAACQCQPVDRPPVWIMRQAGRYLPEYRRLKKKYSFLELAQTPELAARVTLQPMQRYAFDAAITFSDILVIPEALGQPYRFKETGGIEMEYRIENRPQIDRLDPTGIREKLGYVAETQKIVRRELGDGKALLGFGGSPWTLATYMVEGGHSDNFLNIKNLFFNQRNDFEALMEKITAALVDYFKMQIDAGVDALQIFDSWGAACAGALYAEMSLCWVRRIIDSLDNRVPVILFAKGMAANASALASSGASVLSVDWTVDLADFASKVGLKIAVQGNLDPVVLNTEPGVVCNETRRILDSMKNRPGHIFNLGHGILPNAKLENVDKLVETVHNYS